MNDYRPELPDGMPAAIAALPVHRGYPVPWFVAWLREDKGVPVATLRGYGEPDFRILYPGAPAQAYRLNLCWICGEPMKLGMPATFVIGPMCAINRTSAEPPSHEECADWAARACPFLARPHMVRRDAGLPAETHEGPGIMLRRNPGVTLLWTSHGYGTRDLGTDELLFNVGDPIRVRWLREGRDATRDEIMESIESGMPALVALAEQQEGGIPALTRMLSSALQLLPKDTHARVSATDIQPAG